MTAQAATLAGLLDSWGTPPDRKAAVLSAFNGDTAAAERVSLRLLRMGEAARVTGLSRQTLWRVVKAGRLAVVEVRPGSFRVPESALRAFVEGRKP